VSSIAILDYGLGNLRSVARAVERMGGRPEVTSNPDRVADAGALVLPGVGSFGVCMRALRGAGLEPAIRAAVEAGRPVLGVCLGLQILFEGSDEASEPGLGLLPGRVERLPSSVKVPHMGWNSVVWTSRHPWVAQAPDGSHFYFVHSFAVPAEHPATVGVTEYGRPLAAAVAKGPIFATQFHPEKSGPAGLALYGALVRRVEAAA